MPDFPYAQQYSIASLSGLFDFAAQLANWLAAGDIVALDGTLGAGKTTLSRALGEALGLDDAVTSPTFTLLHEYDGGPFPVLHADLYRLGNEGGAEAFAQELLESAASQSALLLVEWAVYASFLTEQATVSIQLAFAPRQHADSNHPAHSEEVRLISILAYRPIVIKWPATVGEIS